MKRITSRIKCAYAKQLSYAGRLQIINHILFSIHSFWGTIFILPQNMLKEVYQKCKDFLWGGSEEKRKVSLVAWDTICRPKKSGGLNIKACNEYNKASVGKLLWQVIEKKDTLCVKWVHGVYMKKDTNIWNHKPQQDNNWYRRKLNFLKEEMKDWHQHNRFTLSVGGEYSISNSYIAIIGVHGILETAILL